MADDLLQMFQSITTADHDELVDQFAHLLELDVGTATFFLESSNWNVETAVNNYLATMEPALYHDGGYHQHHQHQVDDLAMDDEDDQDADADSATNATNATTNADASARYGAQFVTDLFMVPSTIIPPGTVVDMQWSFINSGSLQWPMDTHLIFSQGDRFDGPVQIPMAAIGPGARIDLAIRLRTPEHMGTFAGSWRLVAPQGPIGKPVWITLNVGPTKHEAFQPTMAAGVPITTAAAAGAFGTGGAGNNDEEMMDL